MMTISLILALAVSNSWPITQADVSDAFFVGEYSRNYFYVIATRIHEPTLSRTCLPPLQISIRT